jgi:hypothetical protein
MKIKQNTEKNKDNKEKRKEEKEDSNKGREFFFLMPWVCLMG